MVHLENAVEKSLPCGPGLDLLALAVDEIPVKLTTASVNIHLSGPEPTGTLPEVTADPKGNDDEEGKVRLEEILGGTDAFADGRDSSVELLSVSLSDIDLRKGLKHT